MGPFGPISKRRFSARYFFSLAGTENLTYFCSKSGYSEQINQTIDAQSGALSSISGQSNSLCVATAHGLELTCQYLGRHLVRAQRYRDLRVSAFREWSRAVA